MPTTARLTCIIVDDNEINRLTLEHLVDLTPELELVASLPGGLETLTFFRGGGHCDLILLDVEMPTLTGLELAKLLPKPTPAIVLVTTHRDFAVAAFELQAVDYLVKPVEFVRFSQAISKVLAQRPAAPPVVKAAESPADLFVKVGTKTIKINFDDVLYIEALSTYSVIVTTTQKHIVYLTLKALIERLPFAHFVRVHRSYIVNMRRIEAIEDNMLKLGPYEIPVGKSYHEEFSRHLRSL
ncbi:LytTR family DNA-binding domain-containing protein [Hymenobacter ginsengisoli]|uniref:LytTR family DNA-binding domain-containing protein n=1 Tax=Hymenobacter ginsengisoli TaxID=1051626 RepID=A0ABP8Q4M1_9BACT|nr:MULTISPECIES: LytTR family DNA-binding domain-containing protein [unclassified Hymenobacter]MBO2032520.1 response regulator transcription factor [Hymenobacter sp. BT559]